MLNTSALLRFGDIGCSEVSASLAVRVVCSFFLRLFPLARLTVARLTSFILRHFLPVGETAKILFPHDELLHRMRRVGHNGKPN